MSFFPNLINGLQVTHTSPTDGTVVFTSNTTITASGFPFAVDDGNCTVASILYKDSATSTWKLLANGINGVSITAASNVITVTGAGTPFASGDVYYVSINQQQKTFVPGSNAGRGSEIDPIDQAFVPETIVDVTNETDGTNEYFIDMSGFRSLNLHLIISGGSGTMTVTIEVSAQDDGTPAATVAYIDKTNEVFGSASFTATNFLFDDAKTLGGAKFVKIKTVSSTGGANDADVTIYSKKLY